MIKFSAQSHIGQRQINEDSYFVDEELGLYIVADGVGGLYKGEIASKLSCQVIYESIKSGSSLVKALETAHQKLIDQIDYNSEKKGMASTVVVALFKKNSYQLAWVGDSRAYLWDESLKLISRDHSYVELLRERGHISFAEMENHPNKNIIAQALGINREPLVVAVNQGTLENNQILMLSTDGLYEIAKEKTVIEEINKTTDIEQLTKSLVAYAVQEQGKDNITLVSIQSHSDTLDKNNRILADVVRTYDAATGDAKEIKRKNSKQNPAKNNNPLRIKSIRPKNIESKVNNNNEAVNVLEFLLFIVVFITLMVFITLLM